MKTYRYDWWFNVVRFTILSKLISFNANPLKIPVDIFFKEIDKHITNREKKRNYKSINNL